MSHLVIGQRQKAPNFLAFHWSTHGFLITIGQHFVTTRVVHLPKRTETGLITESDQSRANHQLLQQLCTVRTAWSDSDQAVRAMHSCKSWFLAYQGHHCLVLGLIKSYSTDLSDDRQRKPLVTFSFCKTDCVLITKHSVFSFFASKFTIYCYLIGSHLLIYPKSLCDIRQDLITTALQYLNKFMTL